MMLRDQTIVTMAVVGVDHGVAAPALSAPWS